MTKPMFPRLFRSLLLLLSLTGCDYKAVSSDEKTTISIPYVEGDKQGQLTGEIVRELNQSNLYDFVRQDGDLVLKVALLPEKSEPVGFKYDRSVTKGKIERNLMVAENRQTLTAEVTLHSAATEEVILGPLKVSAFTDIDYIDINSLKELAFINAHGKQEKTIRFSLGQLDSIEGAQDAALTPLYRQLAQKIVAALQQERL